MSVQLTFLLCASLVYVEYLAVRILPDTTEMIMGFFLLGSRAGLLLLSA